MLLEDLKKCISDMEELQQLEQAFKDSQKQEKADTLYVANVTENDKVVKQIEAMRKYVTFIPSADLIAQLKSLLAHSQECVTTGFAQEQRIKTLQNETKNVKALVTGEWSTFFAEVSDKRVSMLTTVKEITSDKEKTGYAITKIKNGAILSFESSDRVRLLRDGITEADKILVGLGLNDDVMNFLKKVSEGSATINDLTDEIIAWINYEKLTGKFRVGFSN